ncbi:MAG: antibiotic biosynthesis monooxygenase [Tannerella sp.]|jgi:quinol monooxygenase YgiN|nr:antibiotic biosynthesis monooxygenase [Tannerella sp.]
MKKIFIVLFISALFGASCQNSGSGKADEKTAPAPPPIVEKAKKVTIVARATVKAGQEEAFKAVALPLVEATNKEPGNLFYHLYQSPIDPTQFIFYEEYTDQAAFDAHAGSEHFKKFAAAIPDMLAGDLSIGQF